MIGVFRLLDVSVISFLSDLCVCVNLHSGILSDLFPGVSIPEHDYGVLHSTIQESLVKKNLQPLASTIKKVRGRKCFYLCK